MTTAALFPQARHQQTDTTHDPNEDIDYEANSICPVCEIDYDHTKEYNWVFCDKCRQWYHFRCVNLQDAPSSERWYCPRCLPLIAEVTSGPPENQAPPATE